MRTHLALGRQAVLEQDFAAARRWFEAALESPENLGEARHPLANYSNVRFWTGIACRDAGDLAAAERHWMLAANARSDFQQMSVRVMSEMTFYSAMALDQLGESHQANDLLRRLLRYARQLAREQPAIDYFATSLPAMLLFEEDLKKRNLLTAHFLEAQARHGLGQTKRARTLIRNILEQDPNHGLAADFAREMDCLAQVKGPTVRA